MARSRGGGSHSLRIGGATALYNYFKDIELVKRFGRWRSGAFHVYLWEGNDLTRGVAKAMSAENLSLLTMRGLGHDALREQMETRSMEHQRPLADIRLARRRGG